MVTLHVRMSRAPDVTVADMAAMIGPELWGRVQTARIPLDLAQAISQARRCCGFWLSPAPVLNGPVFQRVRVTGGLDPRRRSDKEIHPVPVGRTVSDQVDVEALPHLARDGHRSRRISAEPHPSLISQRHGEA